MERGKGKFVAQAIYCYCAGSGKEIESLGK